MPGGLTGLSGHSGVSGMMGGAVAGGGGFIPSTYSGYTAEYDADKDTFTTNLFAVAATANGTAVGGWKDQNSNTNPVSNSNATQYPILHTGGPNGHNFIQSDGSNDFLSSSTSPLNHPETFYVVLRIDTWSSTKQLAGGSFAGLSGIFSFGSTPALMVSTGSGSGATESDLAVSTWGVLTGQVISNTQGMIRANLGTRHTSSSMGSGSDLGSVCLFSAAGASLSAACSIARVIFYNANHSTSDQDAIVTALMSAYGL